MRSIEIAIAILNANPTVSAILTAVEGVDIDVNTPLPHAIIHLIYDDEQVLLQGATQWPQDRITVEVRANGAVQLRQASEAINDAFRDIHLVSIAGYKDITIRKEGSDVTDSSSQTSASPGPDVKRRSTDYYVRFRNAG